ncbi:CDP-alcohol phosphatidyltransferase family protein [Vampirovibrio sp.]|uniref:CDP-alcohol phosphatidyltransferase family protein n=1 Tax=Vampirovibrio sp. TaxID=2717857 RepID=UPI003593B45C
MPDNPPPPIKPDLGLYQTKYLLRNILRNIPGVGALSPNALSLFAVVPGLLAAWFLMQGQWLAALLSIMGRMIVNTLDGLVAEEFNKKSNLGAYLNRLPGEFTDILIVLALSWKVAPVSIGSMLLVPLTGWVQILGLLGLAAGGTTQSVGPCGQTDRLAIIAIGCLLALLGLNGWPILIPILCIGCGLTIVLRIFRSIRDIRKLDQTQEHMNRC